MSAARVLVVDDERVIGIAIVHLLEGKGWEVEAVQTIADARRFFESGPVDLLITDLGLRGESGMDLLRWTRDHSPETAVMMITAYGSEKVAVEAMKLGAVDYLPKPFDNDELELKAEREVKRALERAELRALRERVRDAAGLEAMVGRSPAMQRVYGMIRKVADTDLTVLVRGPSGTGKELVADALHAASSRRGRPLVKVNCAAFSRELVESELFGHEKGAFTGAVATRQGKFEVASGGTIFLDEIGDMPIETQAKILRTLQEKEIERVGGNRTMKVDVRIVAATNQDLEARVKDGSFREDLFYRLNVVQIRMPSLVEREGDLPALVEHFLARAASRLRRDACRLSPAAYRAVLAHAWPGNVRELEHAIELAVALSSGEDIELEDLPPGVLASAAASDAARPRAAREGGDPPAGAGIGAPGAAEAAGSPAGAGMGAPGAAEFAGSPPATAGTAPELALGGWLREAAGRGLSFREAKQQLVERFERESVLTALARHQGNVSRAAEDLGIYRQSLQTKLAELGIDPAEFRSRS